MKQKFIIPLICLQLLFLEAKLVPTPFTTGELGSPMKKLHFDEPPSVLRDLRQCRLLDTSRYFTYTCI